MVISFTIRSVLGWLITYGEPTWASILFFLMSPPPISLILSNLFEASAESFKHFLHVATLLHGDDPSMILLIHPD